MYVVGTPRDRHIRKAAKEHAAAAACTKGVYMLLLLLLPKYAGRTHAEFMLLLLFLWKCGEQGRALGEHESCGCDRAR
jgi:hypothetical protein